ncbi:hypothetical protein CTI14_70310, partial [Methylobacterium radiotolerans]
MVPGSSSRSTSATRSRPRRPQAQASVTVFLKDIVSARVIPSRGAWLEFEIDKRDQVASASTA